VHLSDLINAGLLQPGMPLFPRRRKFADRVATLLPDGQVDIDGVSFPKPSGAAASITGKSTNGFWFFLVDQASRRSLRDVWRDYVDALAVDVEDEEADDDSDDDEV
jgi:RAMA domain-containing protein